jgi:hypothetical protein
MQCDGNTSLYAGGVWHDPRVHVPNCTETTPPVCTRFYLCINNGCPDAGAAKMECKDGYTGPMCAVCDHGYFKSIRDCARCDKPRVVAIICFVLGIVTLTTLAAFLTHKFRRHLEHAFAFSHLKVVVSFLTVSTSSTTN